MGVNDMSLNIVGERFTNEDGSRRQIEIECCTRGEHVRLRREPGNWHDPNCVQVLSARGVQIGTLSAEHAAWMARKVESGTVRGIVERIHGGTANTSFARVCIRVNWEGEDPELPAPKSIIARLLRR